MKAKGAVGIERPGRCFPDALTWLGWSWASWAYTRGLCHSIHTIPHISTSVHTMSKLNYPAGPGDGPAAIRACNITRQAAFNNLR